MKNSIGIFMPAYNVEKYCRESIRSIINQTYKNWELVIIDDNSTDQTYNRCLDESMNDSRISVIARDSHCGRIGQVKNEAIELLSKNHEYICHVGSDDRIPSNSFEIFVNYMDKHQEIGVCCGNFICFDDSGKTWTFPHVANSEEYDSSVLLKYMCLYPLRFYRKAIVESVGGYAVDYDLALKVDEVTKIHRIKDPITYHYRQHEQQVSTKARPEQNLNAKKALENALKRRNINGEVENNQPPFNIKNKEEEHFIWGAK
jgi:glycosyltransferase involved in cell wall biosynthesis